MKELGDLMRKYFNPDGVLPCGNKESDKVYTDETCDWCKKAKCRKSRVGCYGNMTHCICLTPKCGHEWDIIE